MLAISRNTILALVATTLAAGCAAEPEDTQDHACHAIRAAEAADPNAMPDEIIAYLAKNHWSHMHLDFHLARMWDVLGGETQQWAADQGIERAPLQEGEPTTGLEFLAMHRLMIDELRTMFPQYADLFAGWKTPPTDPRDAETPLPGDATTPFDPSMLTAIDRIENAEFASDDDFALFLQTRRRPTATNPRALSTDRSAGMHNYLHNRFADDASPITVGDPSVNLQNRVFWRIHGWVDAKWTAYRKAKGLDDRTDEVYVKALGDARVWMESSMDRAMASGKEDDGCSEPPTEVKHLFDE